MKRMAVVLALTLAVGVALGIIGSQILNAQQQPITRNVLLQKDMGGMDGKEVVILVAEIAPGASTGKHYHPGHEAIYILQGSGTLEMEGMAPTTLKAGDAGYITAKHQHEAKNSSRTDPLKILVVASLHEKGQPLATPVTPAYFWK